MALATSILICAAVVTGYFAFLTRYAVNGAFWDEWNWVGMIRRDFAGTLTVGDLWLQHNESRMLVPNAIVLVLAEATDFNDTIFMYLGAMLLLAAVLLLIVACRHELVKHPLAFVPAIFLVFSRAQYENILWGFQFAWFMVVACLCGVLLLLTASRIGVWRLFAALAIGVVASCSLLQGLEIWPAGLMALMRPGTSMRMRATWCAAGIIATALYLSGFNFARMGGPPLSELPTHLSTAALGVFVAVGNVLLLTAGGTDYLATIAFGALISVVGAGIVVSWWIRGRGDRVLTIAAAFVIVGFIFDLLLMPGRLSAGLINGTPSRYTTFNLLIIAGAYIGGVRTIFLAAEGGGPRGIVMSRALIGLAAALVLIQVVTSTREGEAGAVRTHSAHAEAANLTANYDIAPPSLVMEFAYPPSYEYFKSQAEFLMANRLNVFSDGESVKYRETGVLAGGEVTSPLPVPRELGDIRSNATQWRAWLALSSVYEQRPDLQAAFPGPTLQASSRLIAWAVQSGMEPHDPIYAPVLMPYAEQYKTWAATNKSPG